MRIYGGIFLFIFFDWFCCFFVFCFVLPGCQQGERDGQGKLRQRQESGRSHRKRQDRPSQGIRSFDFPRCGLVIHVRVLLRDTARWDSRSFQKDRDPLALISARER